VQQSNGMVQALLSLALLLKLLLQHAPLLL
jgi:hypothetical protein